jgi:hypothetical protein
MCSTSESKDFCRLLGMTMKNILDGRILGIIIHHGRADSVEANLSSQNCSDCSSRFVVGGTPMTLDKAAFLVLTKGSCMDCRVPGLAR